MKAGYRYDAKICYRCGNLVHYNWYIRHRRSGCVSGIVTPLRLTTGSTVTAAPVDLAANNLIEAQPQVNPTVRLEGEHMRFLLPIGGYIPEHFVGVLTGPGHATAYGDMPKAIKDGSLWAADNQTFTKGFDPAKFFPWLKLMEPYRDRCLFVAVPDCVGNCQRTRSMWNDWSVWFSDWPRAFVGQDGETDIPETANALFVGGTTDWKLSQQAADLIQLARSRNLHVHVGRVNWGRRYRHFQRMLGSESFTCDGTRTRFDGREKTLRAWSGYQAQGVLLQW